LPPETHFLVNKKNNTRNEVSAENLRKSLRRGEHSVGEEAGAFLMCTESGASVAEASAEIQERAL
jgi:hypothetical protein